MDDRVTRYAIDVLEGKEVAGRYVKLACQRHIDDLEKSKLAPYKYEFDLEKALESIDFFEDLRFTDGEIAGQQVKLFGFQDFIVGSIFGWVCKGTGYRRFKKSYVQLARKNAKSLLNSGIGIKLAAFDKYPNAQVYCTATKMKQARIVWKQARKFIEIEPDLREIFKIKDHDAIIESLINGGEIMALGRDTGTIDGFDPHGGIIDEYHSHKTNQMVKLLEDGSVNQAESLISIITTAGFNLNGPCYKEWEYCKNVLEGIVNNDEYFIYIAQMDVEDDIWDPNNWLKANPLVAKLPKGLENLKRFAEESKQKGGDDLKNFLTKSLNIWYEFSNDQYIGPSVWKVGASKLTLENFKGKTCYAGLDLSSGGDLTSLALIFPYEFEKENGEKVRKYFIHSHSFIPKRRVAEHIQSDDVPYDVWIENGLLTVTETLGGIKTDYKYIIKYLKDLIEKFQLKIIQLGYDPHNADTFLQDLEELGFDCVEIFQSCKWLNDPTEDFKLECEAGNIEYNEENELLSWSVVNAKLVSNSNGEIKIDKNLQEKRIDPVDAVIDAYKLAFKSEKLNTKVDINKYAEKDFLNKLWG
ncbi:terminase large subunit [Clostridium perfringens]|uniref:terminase large subunit n=1 Tax=Clostridium perfringens TaxID=1502 RepID=UPI002B1F03AD|nr:terminase TerL endonuclease subunit [Clostridium perfringens]MEA5268962.1 terminase TerL endonuclease subunit [Clostridium perfringens]MEA5271582.1 terminase TerL endonuclease subunit [Clostridium perfringens]MEA5342122.1 terminase TerL endonuclease subunit [Clostridium perfringens]MEA5380652.1 terminase TerL endonuclease subunit [Clostridium perfringens]